MPSIEHPIITELNRKGYVGATDQECWGKDYYGELIVTGNDVVEFDGDIVLKDNLERYLTEVWNFKFHTME